MTYTFSVDGTAATKGSTKSFISRGTRRVVTIHDNRNLPAWTTLVQIAARWSLVRCAHHPHPVKVTAVWSFPLPKYAKKRPDHVYKPDIDKLARALLDSLSGIAYDDDNQVTTLTAGKVYGPIGSETTCTITIDVPDAAVAV